MQMRIPPSLLLLSIACSSGLLSAQSGRAMVQLSPAPVTIGQTASFALNYPASAAGNIYLLLWSSPSFPGAVPVIVPGFSVSGLLRVNALALQIPAAGVLNGSGQSPAWGLAIPNLGSLVGFDFDLQGADLAAGNTLTLSDNDVGVLVSAPLTINPALNMVPIAAGSFSMGSNATTGAPYYSQSWERPVHQVTITRPFWIGKYEVTQAEYQALMGSNPSNFQGASWPNSSNRPVEQVTWNNAMAYCAALTAQAAAAGQLPLGYQYRLPTEAEWEYCCRAGTTTEFHYGNSLDCSQAKFVYSWHTSSSCPSPSTVAVGGYVANAWGLHDMHGNVFEWCLDSWDGSANYPSAAVTDPYVNSGPIRVFRGGGWNGDSDVCRSAYRLRSDPTYWSFFLGFRVVLAPVLV